MILGFAYFYAAITFDPHQQADVIRKQGGYIPGIRPGPPTERHLQNILNRITLPGALWLAFIALLPSIMLAFWNIQNYPVRGHDPAHLGRRGPGDHEAGRQPADAAQLRGLPEVVTAGGERSSEPRRPAGDPRQAGGGQGDAGGPAVAPLRRAARRDRGHVPRRGPVRARSSARRPAGTSTPASWSLTRSSSEMVRERLTHDDTTHRGFILDGFPRTAHQAEALMAILEPAGPGPGHQPGDRHRARAAAVWPAGGCASDCGANYSVVDNPPRVRGICDVCGGEVVQRDDDTEAAIRRRLELYERETAPLIDWYERAGPARQSGRPRAAPTRSPTGWWPKSTSASSCRLPSDAPQPGCIAAAGRRARAPVHGVD